MLAAVGIALGLLLGYATGGKLRNLSGVRIRMDWLLIVAYLVQGLLRGRYIPLSRPIVTLGWALCGLIAIWILASQMRTPGLGLCAIGTGLNLFVVLLNGGMPALVSAFGQEAVATAVAEASHFYVEAGHATRCAFLGDVLPLMGGLASIGDVLLAVGLAIFLAWGVSPAVDL